MFIIRNKILDSQELSVLGFRNMNLLQKLLGNYTGIPNRMIENVLCKYNLPKREMRIFFALARASWGWQREGEYMTQRKLCELTNINPGNISKTIKSMVNKCIIITRNRKDDTYFEINRDYMTWRLPERDGLFTEALKLSTGSIDGVIARDHRNSEKDNSGDIPRDNKAVIPRDNLTEAERRGIAYFEGRVKKFLNKEELKKT